MPSPVINRTMNAREWGLLLLLSLIWGCSFFFIAVSLWELPPLTVVTLRVAIAALALHVVIRAMGIALPMTRRVWAWFLVMALINNVIPFTLLTWGQLYVASGVASILNATTPIFTALIAHVATQDEKLTPNRAAGVILGLIGVVMMVGGSALREMTHNLAGELAIVGAAVSYGLSSIFARRFSTIGVPPLASAAGLLTMSSVILLPAMLIVDQPWLRAVPSLPVVLAVLASSLVATAFAYLIYFRLVATAGATNLMLSTFLMPVTAITLGILLLGEELALRHVAGLALIALGLAAIDGRLLSKLRRTALGPAE
jgi:drug/metabolite transporter (DMT)-like permease